MSKTAKQQAYEKAVAAENLKRRKANLEHKMAICDSKITDAEASITWHKVRKTELNAELASLS